MPHPSHRLDLVYVPRGPSDSGERLLQELQSRGMVDGFGQPGPAAEDLVVGGFARVRLDLPDRRVLYAFGQGGFQVRCPGCGASVLESFGRATRSERGSPGPVDCEACGFRGSVEDLLYRPPAAWGAWAVVVADVGSAHLTPFGEELFREHLVGARQVWRRVS